MNKRAYWLALFFFFHPVIWAIDEVRIQAGHWSFEPFSASQFDVSLLLTDEGGVLEATTDELVLPAPWGKLKQVKLRCEQVRWQTEQVDCQQGKLAFQHDQYGQQQLDFRLSAQPEKQHYQLSLNPIQLAGGQFNIEATLKQQHWQANIVAKQIQLAQLPAIASTWLTPTQQQQLESYAVSGVIDLHVAAEGQSTQLTKLEADWSASQLEFANAEATQVAEAVSLSGQLVVTQSASNWQWQLSSEFDAGQIYSDPVFVDVSAYPFTIKATGSANDDFGRVDVSHLQFNQPKVIDAELSLSVIDGAVKQVSVSQFNTQLNPAYANWAQPFLVGSAAEKLSVAGQVSGRIEWSPTDYLVDVKLKEIDIVDANERFSIIGLFGEMNVGSDDRVRHTWLSWQKAQVYTTPIGIAEVNLESVGQKMKLIDGLNLPVMDGLLMINDLSLERYDSGLVDWRFDGELTPISMEKLSHAFGWPTLHGMLSGTIPEVRYQNQQLVMDGTLALNLFDGTMLIRQLSMTSPLGVLPQLNADIDITRLDLELLTKTFDLGRITGRMDGYVHNLRLADWLPVQFDAKLATATSNPGKRRISQKAVDNLTQIGGGATGMLSRSFLRFFEDFSYQKLGISCRLQNEVCLMDGVEPADQGYYIVKGGGLPPWINVVGYTHRVDWTDLIERLKAVQNSEGPVIQ